MTGILRSIAKLFKGGGHDQFFAAPYPSAITSSQSPREIIQADYPHLNGGRGLPIRGGWGYTKKDACIIGRDDPPVDPDLPLDFVGVEREFVEKRIYEEMIIFRPRGDGYSGIQWNLKRQALIRQGVRSYDHLIFEISAFRDEDWLALKQEFEGPDGAQAPDFDMADHLRRREALCLRFNREFWFDITDKFRRSA